MPSSLDEPLRIPPGDPSSSSATPDAVELRSPIPAISSADDASALQNHTLSPTTTVYASEPVTEDVEEKQHPGRAEEGGTEEERKSGPLDVEHVYVEDDPREWSRRKKSTVLAYVPGGLRSRLNQTGTDLTSFLPAALSPSRPLERP